jgi:hypothetical protein
MAAISSVSSGVSYPIFTQAGGSMGANASLGYRTQTIKTDSDGGFFQESRDLRDVRDGGPVFLNFTM